jgi:hypothetical protein
MLALIRGGRARYNPNDSCSRAHEETSPNRDPPPYTDDRAGTAAETPKDEFA